MPGVGRHRPIATTGQRVAFVVFVTIWCTGVLAFDAAIGYVYLRNHVASQQYLQTTGVVTSSQVGRSTGGKSTTYGPNITYDYTVQGVLYHGTRWDFNRSMTVSDGWVRDAVAAHPVGSSATVYYDPADPSQSVLSLADVIPIAFVLTFLTPFNAVTLSAGLAAVKAIVTRRSIPFSVQVLRNRPGRAIVRDATYSPLSVALGVLLLGGLVTALVVAIAVAFHPSTALSIVALLALLTGAIVAGLIARARFDPARRDLVFDFVGGNLQLPALPSGIGLERIPLSNIRSFQADLDKEGKFATYAVCNGPPHQSQLVHILDGAGADPERFAALLTSLLSGRT